MNITRRSAALGGLSLLAGTSMSTMSRAELGSFLGIGEGLEDFWLATDAYIYRLSAGDDGDDAPGHHQRRRAGRKRRAPMGQIIKLRAYPNASFRDVTAPNADTLYTTASSTSARSRGCSASPT